MSSILLIEDDQSLLVLYEEKFRLEGFTFLAATDGETGLKSALQNHPDVILLDILLPKMNGLDMLTELRKNPWGAKVPVILLTNLDTTDEILKNVTETQPSYYLVKANTTPKIVIEKVRDVLGKNHLVN